MLLLIILFGLCVPRVILVVCWLAGTFAGVWAGWLWPILGFLFMPYTTLAYGLAHSYGGGVEGGWLIAVIVAVVFDLSSNGKTATAKRGKKR
jgi:hypothetical protein